MLGASRLLLPPAALFFLLSQVHTDLWPRVALRQSEWLVLALVVNQATLVMFAARLRSILSLFDIRIGFLASMRIHLQSMFYFFAVPMTVGLEISRFVKIRAIADSAPVTALTAALLFDRLLGAGSALAVAALCLPFLNIGIPLQSIPPWAALLLGAALAVTAFVFRNRLRPVLRTLWQASDGKRLAFSGLFLFSMSMHVLFAFGIKLCALAFGLQIAFVHVVFSVAGGMLLVAIPVSLAGIGPAEAGSAGLLVAFGYAPPAALLVGTLPYFARLVAAGEGGVWELIQGGIAAVSKTRQFLLQARPALAIPPRQS